MADFSAWEAYKAITVQDANVDGNLTDFRCLVVLDEDADIGGRSQANGEDWRFTLSDGTTQLPHEIESVTIAGGLASGNIWVKVPSIAASGGASIRIYYGNDGAGDGQDAANVYDANFLMSHHMVDDTTSTILDSTGNDNDGTKKGANEPVEAAGVIHQGQDFDGSDDHIFILNSKAGGHDFTALSDSISISAWINADAFPNPANPTEWIVDNTVIELRIQGGAGVNKVPFSFGINNDKVSLGVSSDHTTEDERVTAATTLSTGIDYQIGFSISGDDWILYRNGVSDGSGTFSTATGNRSVGVTLCNMIMGMRTGNTGNSANNAFDGLIDELSISDVTRAPEWFKFHYHNVTSGELTFGAEVVQAGFVPYPHVPGMTGGIAV